MFIGRIVNESTNSVRRCGIQVELHHSGDLPLLRTEPEGSWIAIYKHVTPNGANRLTARDEPC
jgi:hypothetical protein